MKQLLSLMVIPALLCSCNSTDKLVSLHKELVQLNIKIQEEEQLFRTELQQAQTQIRQLQEQLNHLQSHPKKSKHSLNVKKSHHHQAMAQKSKPKLNQTHERNHVSELANHGQHRNRESAESRAQNPQKQISQGQQGYMWFTGPKASGNR